MMILSGTFALWRFVSSFSRFSHRLVARAPRRRRRRERRQHLRAADHAARVRCARAQDLLEGDEPAIGGSGSGDGAVHDGRAIGHRPGTDSRRVKLEMGSPGRLCTGRCRLGGNRSECQSLSATRQLHRLLCGLVGASLQPAGHNCVVSAVPVARGGAGRHRSATGTARCREARRRWRTVGVPRPSSQTREAPAQPGILPVSISVEINTHGGASERRW